MNPDTETTIDLGPLRDDFAGGIFTFFCGLLGLLIPGAILFYLLQGRIRDLFGVGGTSSY